MYFMINATGTVRLQIGKSVAPLGFLKLHLIDLVYFLYNVRHCAELVKLNHIFLGVNAGLGHG